MFKRFVLYSIIGSISSGIHLTAAFSFLYFINHSLFLSNIFGFAWAYGFSYIAQSKFVFDRRVSMTRSIKYFFVQLASLLVSISLANMAGKDNVYFKVLLVVIILPITSFLVHKKWTFANHELRQAKTRERTC